MSLSRYPNCCSISQHALCFAAAEQQNGASQENLNKVLVFNKLDRHLQRKVVSEMYERAVTAGEILIKEGDTGLAASELYVVKSGKFEVSKTLHSSVWTSPTNAAASVSVQSVPHHEHFS